MKDRVEGRVTIDVPFDAQRPFRYLSKREGVGSVFDFFRSNDRLPYAVIAMSIFPFRNSSVTRTRSAVAKGRRYAFCDFVSTPYSSGLLCFVSYGVFPSGFSQLCLFEQQWGKGKVYGGCSFASNHIGNYVRFTRCVRSEFKTRASPVQRFMFDLGVVKGASTRELIGLARLWVFAMYWGRFLNSYSIQ